MTTPQRSILEKTARGAGWVVAWRVMTRGLGLVSTLVLVRLLAPADFGLVALGASFATSIEVFGWIGLEEGVIRQKEPTRALYDTAFTLAALRGLLMGGVIAALALPAAAFFADPRLASVVWALALAVALEGLTNIGIVDFRRDFSFQKEFRLFLLPRLISIALAMAVAFAFRSYWALIAGVLANRVLRVVFSYVMHPYRPRPGLGAWRLLTSYSLWTWLLSMLCVARDRSDSILVGRMLGTAEVGFYAVGYEIAELPTTELIHPLTRAAFPGFAAAQHGAGDSGQTWLRLVAAMALLTLPAGVGASAVASPLVALAFGPVWSAAAPLVQVLAIALCMTVFGLVSEAMFSAQGRLHTAAAITAIGLVLRVALLAALIPAYGLLGAAMAAGVAITAEQTLLAAFAMRRLRVSFVGDLLPRLWRCFAATAVMAAVLYGAGFGWHDAAGREAISLTVAIGLGTATYVVTLIALWLVSGRPAGPEADVLTLAGRFSARLRPAG